MSARKPKKNERTSKRKETIKKRQDENKAKFLAKLEEMPIIQVAAAQTGIHRSTYYDWRDTDPSFKDACQKASTRGVEFVNDMMESLLIKSAKEGKVVPMIFWLKSHHPQYMEIRRYEHFHKHEFQESILTEERKEEIARVMKNWSEPDTGDERDEDYELPSASDEEDGRGIKSGPAIPAEDKTSLVESSYVRPVKKRIARMFVPKRKS